MLAILYRKTKHVSCLAECTSRNKLQIFLGKYRFGVSGSKGLQQFQFLHQPKRYIGYRHRYIDMDFFLQIVLRQRTDFIDFLTKRLHILFPHGKSRRHLMPAIFGEKAAAFRHFFINMIPFDGTCAAFYALFAPGQHKGRAVIAFPDSSGDDTGDALMTIRQKNDQNTVVL